MRKKNLYLLRTGSGTFGIFDENVFPKPYLELDTNNSEKLDLEVNDDFKELMNVNTKILSEVDAYVGVEGNISHMCRAMKIPSLLLYNLLNSKPPAVDINNNVLKNVVKPYIDSNVQKLVTSEEELLKNIPNFINDLT